MVVGDPRNLRHQNPIGVDAHYGKIASAPSTLADKVWIIIPDFEEAMKWGPCRWMPRYQVVVSIDLAEPAQIAHVGGVAEAPHIITNMAKLLLPKIGDECLVQFDNRRTPWIISWWPY